MSEIYRQKIDHPAAWRGEDIRDSSEWIHELNQQDVAELDAALRNVRALKLDLPRIGRENFPLPTLSARIAGWSEQIENGRGFVLVRGFPAENYSLEDVETIFWGIGTYLGLPVTQNPRGELMGHVKDYGRKFGNLDVRGYETNAHLPFHTDGCDLVGLMCWRKAKSGGRSSIVSALAIHNEINERCPQFLPALYRGFRDIKREAALTNDPVTASRIPVFGQINGIVSCRYVRAQIEAAMTRLGEALTDHERAALDCVDRLAVDPLLRIDMDLQPGDMQLCNNYTILHSRTDFEDWDEPERRRLMLRLWLSFRQRRPLPSDFPQHNGYGLGQIAEIAFSA
ncbi:TauD/TfdA family dioxygenase [uncultured Pigmentiphaga sp.]|uniref:TauD/TfdA family dioxygenase n=1 Tax=uncultured Pigmentiphaga sp. TaxID=340361 RepID=UPI00263177CC|nr:TauD/TfdA family dioxygenase [uncultured Pigmentiphaga sp.]